MNLRRKFTLGTILLVVLAALPSLALCGQWPHERDGVVLGFNVGGGTAGLDVDNASSDRESGAAANVRVAYAFRPEFTFGLESNIWTKEIDGVTWTFSVVAAGFTYYPSGQGLFLRAGIGSGTISAEISQGGTTLSADDSGIGLLGAIGYEWRLTRKFALGPQADFGFMDVGDNVSANYFNLTAALNWYL